MVRVVRSEHASGSPLPELATAITAGAVRLAAATAAWLRLIAEFDRREGWHGVRDHVLCALAGVAVRPVPRRGAGARSRRPCAAVACR